ncbi:translation initiation factor eIF epsilon subunit, putative [Babesia bigemina]|uniref:Translation initiation factor eIF2B subunit epsilon n=1 Tax=Babesia bigemina TaxID=5866 RepID=A0A061DCF0_BABBI|nr:translation initiation factor eIF epsilon subunit, putative [Babesia bigemina]CDR97757.1 translation initiation factor eIF epsilon subunit, putative [Babesia bigemina]|eukprot:XP_012769943.1 translation initiation factor eIF epsilon subunit, putative [Babesia bigemina]
MEAFMLVADDGLPFEPLASEVPVCDLYLGHNSIFHETLENLWGSGITRVSLVVEKNKESLYKKYERKYQFGRRQGHVDVAVLALNVDKVLPGNVIRELTAVLGGLEDFVMLYWNTLLTIPLFDALELHQSRTKERQRYSMSVLYFEDDRQKRFSKLVDDCMIILNAQSEILAYGPGADDLEINKEWLRRCGNSTQFSLRYDLCRTGIYICNKQVAEHFGNWYEHQEMDEYIVDCLNREFKTDEVYATILKADIMFPTYPPAIRIETPKDYHTVFMEYIKRFEGDEAPSQKLTATHNPQCGPLVHEGVVVSKNNIVGKNVKVGEGSDISRCIIFDDVTIGAECSIHDSIIMNGVVIEDATVIPSGSIVCSNANVTRDMVKGLTHGLRASKMPTRYIDLTTPEGERQSLLEQGDGVHVWPVHAFGKLEDTYIGKSFYDLVDFKVPSQQSTALGSDDESNDEEDEREGSRRRSDDLDSDDEASLSDSESSDIYDETTNPQKLMKDDVAEEFKTLIVECLEAPSQLPNKVLEIKSLKISHNLKKADMVKATLIYALEWVVERASDEGQLQGLIEAAQLKELLDTFEHEMDELDHYDDIFRACSEKQKDVEFFSYLCEALYHSDIMEFEMLHDWLTRNGISGSRINSFAQWLAEE